MSISVIQPGARLHYAAPQILARHGLLRALHTDLHGEHSWMRWLDRAWPGQRQPQQLQRLLGRRLPAGLPATLVQDHPAWTLAGAAAQALGLTPNRDALVTRRLLRDLERTAFAEGDIVYTVLVNEDLDVIRRVKARGVKIVHECIIGPDVGLLMQEEHARYPGLEPPEDSAQMHAGRELDRQKYALCDLILVPSEFTHRAVAELAPAHVPIANVPYGMDVSAFGGAAAPIEGRVLCVGSVGLRKGHPYLAAAARGLASDRSIEFRVVGPAPADLLAHPLMQGPTYVGQVPRAHVAQEFAAADVFAFPTICDSFGLVLIEAMAMGVPVVTTPNCGDVVRDGIDGFIVPPRDPSALAAAVKRIVHDRPLRARMSTAARARAADFSLERYAERLLAAIRSI